MPTRYHICLDVEDRSGVLAAVAGAFADAGVSISTVRQEGHGDDATLVLVTHTAPDESLARTVAATSGRCPGPQGDLGDARGRGVR